MPQIQHNGPGFRYVIGIYREGESQPVEKQEIQDWRINEKFYSVGAQVYEPYIITLRAVNNLGSAGRKAVRIRGFTAEDSRLKLVCLCMRVYVYVGARVRARARVCVCERERKILCVCVCL